MNILNKASRTSLVLALACFGTASLASAATIVTLGDGTGSYQRGSVFTVSNTAISDDLQLTGNFTAALTGVSGNTVNIYTYVPGVFNNTGGTNDQVAVSGDVVGSNWSLLGSAVTYSTSATPLTYTAFDVGATFNIAASSSQSFLILAIGNRGYTYAAGSNTIADLSTIDASLSGSIVGSYGLTENAATFTTSRGSNIGVELVSVTSTVPEPSTFAALAGLGALGFAAARRRRY